MTKKIPVLMFHNISKIKGEKSSVFYKDFYNQIKHLTNLGYKCVNLRNLEDKEFNKKIIITFDDGYENIYKLAMPILNEFNQKATCFIVKNQIDGFNLWDSNRNDYKKYKLMNLNQIQEWNEKGFEIGAHTLDHVNLTKLTTENKNKQINDPIRFFNDKLNISVKSFAYPFGSYDDECIDLLKKNYSYAVTTKPSLYNKKKFTNYEIPRISINSSTSLLKFFLKILTNYEDYKLKFKL